MQYKWDRAIEITPNIFTKKVSEEFFFVFFSFLYCFCVLHSQSCFYNDIIFWAGEAGVYIYEVACAKNWNFQMIKKKKKKDQLKLQKQNF